jgi:hypothetical protein
MFTAEYMLLAGTTLRNLKLRPKNYYYYYYYYCHVFAGSLQLYIPETDHISRVYSVAAVLFSNLCLI